MARKFNQLSARKVESLKEHGVYADGGGLYLQITRTGAKSWLYRFMLNGQARAMGLGATHIVSLKEAREAALECRKIVAGGIDPIESRRAERAEQAASTAKVMTFRQCAEQYIADHQSGWKNPKHGSQWQNTLVSYVYPVFGDLPVEEVDTNLVIKAVKPIWETKTETASRVRGRIESVLNWAKARNLRDGENPAQWKGHLNNLLPAKSKVQKVEHFSALDYQDIGQFMEELRKQQNVSSLGLQLLILTAARTGEVRGAKWSELDLANKLWTIPAERTKTSTEHRVPLSPSAINILMEVEKLKDSDFVFPGGKPRTPLSDGAFIQLLKRMDRKGITAHGFRSSFRDWVAEQTAYPRDVAEMALGHATPNKVEAAYLRTDFFDKRRRLMDDWDTYCSTVGGNSDNVLSIGEANNG
jgi:integrase